MCCTELVHSVTLTVHVFAHWCDVYVSGPAQGQNELLTVYVMSDCLSISLARARARARALSLFPSFPLSLALARSLPPWVCGCVGVWVCRVQQKCQPENTLLADNIIETFQEVRCSSILVPKTMSA